MTRTQKKVRRRRKLGFLLALTLTFAGFFSATRYLSQLSAKSAGEMVQASYTVIPKTVLKDHADLNENLEKQGDFQNCVETGAGRVKETTETSETEESYYFSKPVPERTAVENTYFDDAIFIGNSRTEGFALYSGLGNIRAYTARGASVISVFTDPVISQKGEKVTIMEAVQNAQAFSKAYIMLGINELGWTNYASFIEQYGKIIDALREIQPDVVIYVQSILPVTSEKSEHDAIYNNENIQTLNQLLQKMCEDKQAYYVNVAEAVCDENGALPADSAFDGVHLNRESCETWLDYLKTHTVEEK